jgi:hypothetical protein
MNAQRVSRVFPGLGEKMNPFSPLPTLEEFNAEFPLPTWRELFPNHDRELEECHREREKFFADLERSDP